MRKKFTFRCLRKMLFGASISLLQETKQRSNATISNKSIMIFPVLAASISLVVSSFQSIRVGSACADNAMVLIPYATQSCRGLIAHHSGEKGKRSRKRWLYSQQIGNWLSKSISTPVVQCPLKSCFKSCLSIVWNTAATNSCVPLQHRETTKLNICGVPLGQYPGLRHLSVSRSIGSHDAFKSNLTTCHMNYLVTGGIFKWQTHCALLKTV